MRIATYALALVVVFIAATEIGYRLRPYAGATVPTADSANDHSAGGHATDDHTESTVTSAGAPTGLASTVDGYQLTLLTPRPAQGPSTALRLVINGPDGEPVRAYDTAHGKQLHLIVVRRDLASFQHVHPTQDPATGIWTTTIETSDAGTYRVYADVVPTGHTNIVLGADLAVAGDLAPEPPATTDVRTAEVDGYQVELSGDLHPGRSSTLTATMQRAGRPLTDLQPYLEAYGHLVALRQSDLGYLHVHPEGHPGDGTTPAGPSIEFAVDVPTNGVYRLFLDFQHDGVVHTAPFVIVVHR